MQQHCIALSEINTKAIYFTIPFVWHSRKGKKQTNKQTNKQTKKTPPQNIVQELGTEEEN